APQAAGGAEALRRADPGAVVPVAELDTEALGLATIERPHRVRVDQAVARRERRPEHLVARAIQEREARPELRGHERLDGESVGVLEAPLLECPRPERSVGVEPEIAALAESHFRGVRAKEIQRRAAGLDVHRLPPGGPRP